MEFELYGNILKKGGICMKKFIKKSLLAVVVAALSLTLVKPVSVFALDIDS